MEGIVWIYDETLFFLDEKLETTLVAFISHKKTSHCNDGVIKILRQRLKDEDYSGGLTLTSNLFCWSNLKFPKLNWAMISLDHDGPCIPFCTI